MNLNATQPSYYFMYNHRELVAGSTVSQLNDGKVARLKSYHKISLLSIVNSFSI